MTVLFGDASDGRPTVVKMSPDPAEFAREVDARQRLRAAGLPVLEPAAYQEAAPSTLALPWVVGDALSETHPGQIHEQVGLLLARVHTTAARTDIGDNAAWSDWMSGWLSHALGWWQMVRPGKDRAARELERLLGELAPSMDAACDGAILFDGRPEHFLVGADHRISMIDVEELRTGDIAMDVGVLAVWIPTAVPAIVRGYIAAGGRTGDRFTERVRYYTTLRTLAAAEWHRDHLNDDRTADALLDRLEAEL